MNRKSKRNSPPPNQMTISATMDNKLTDKWSRVLQLISPPNKIRRANEEKEEINDNTSSNDEQEPKKRDSYPTTKQKLLHRRGMYIPTPATAAIDQVEDGPKGLRHKWALYCATHQKLRRNSLPLWEGLHLKKMLVIFQHDKAILQHEANGYGMEFNSIPPRKTAQRGPLVFLNKNPGANHDDEEEDNIPLGTLLEKTKRRSPPALTNSHHAALQRNQRQTPTTTSRRTSNNKPQSLRTINYSKNPKIGSPALPTPVHSTSSNYYYRNATFLQPCYHYHNNSHPSKQNHPVQFI